MNVFERFLVILIIAYSAGSQLTGAHIELYFDRGDLLIDVVDIRQEFKTKIAIKESSIVAKERSEGVHLVVRSPEDSVLNVLNKLNGSNKTFTWKAVVVSIGFDSRAAKNEDI